MRLPQGRSARSAVSAVLSVEAALQLTHTGAGASKMASGEECFRQPFQSKRERSEASWRKKPASRVSCANQEPQGMAAAQSRTKGEKGTKDAAVTMTKGALI